MIPGKEISLNLATNPLRNRRFFLLLVYVLVGILLFVSFFTGKIYFIFRYKTLNLRNSIMRTDQLIRNAQSEERKLTGLLQETIKENKGKVDLVNIIILRKSFSWIEFLSNLEKSLPDSSCIVSLAPTLTDDSRMQLRFKVAYPQLDDLIEFLNNLKSLRFYQIKIINEARNQRGFFVSEISLTYEKNI